MRRSLLFAVLALPIGAACAGDAGGSGSGSGAGDAGGAGGGAAGPVAVAIDTFQFGPKQLTIDAGQTVEFTNNDAIAHTATAADGRFDLQLADKGSTASYTFSEAGTYHYRCTRHPGMEADVVVR